MSNPIVTFEMESGGKMVAELYPEVAPNTVNNFISLIKKGFFDGLILPGGESALRWQESVLVKPWETPPPALTPPPSLPTAAPEPSAEPTPAPEPSAEPEETPTPLWIP